MAPRTTSLLFINQHYYPDVASTGQHLADLAEHLARRGYRVEVLAGGVAYDARSLGAPARETRNGVTIRRVFTTRFGRSSHAGRIINYASFYLHVLRRLVAGPRADGVVLLTTPPLLPFMGWLARRLRGQRYGVWSMDLHPDAEVAAGMLRPQSVAGRLLEWASRRGYAEADFVVDLGEYMKRRLTGKGVDAARMDTVHVWSGRDDVLPTPAAANPIRRALGLCDRFVVMYSGNAGVVHDFDPVLDAMRRLRDHPLLYFLFVGGGPQRARIETYAAVHRIGNFAYRDYFPREALRHSLAAGDAHLVCLRAPFVGVSVPGKLYGAMAAARPVLFVGPARCESADAITAAQCGTVVDPASGDAAVRVAETLRMWAEQPEEVRRLGDRGRAAFLERYDRDKNAAAFEASIRRRWGPPVCEPARTA